MSAICGQFRLDGAPVPAGSVQRVLGEEPGSRVWAPASADRPVALGSRIAPFTPEDAFEEQPLHSRDGRITIVADARVDNRNELTRALGTDAPGPSAPDSAFVLAAYEAWGEDCVRRLLGDFAFIVWDDRRRSLFAARDPLGQRVLFHHTSGNQLSLASSVESLLRARRDPPALDEQKLADFLVLLQDPETTFFADVRRLPAGHVLVADGGGVRIRRYWEPPSRTLRLRSDAEYVEAFRAVFAEAVRARLRAAGGVGVMLSAGLDSSSVAVVAASELAREGRRLAAFHAAPRLGFDGPVRPGWIADESGDVRRIAAGHANMDLWVHRPDGRSLLDCMDDLFAAVGGPIRNPNNLAWLDAIYRRAAQTGVRALLAGHKGNSTISYTGLRSLRDTARRGGVARAVREARAFARVQGSSPWSVVKDQVLIPLLPSAVQHGYSWLRGNRVRLPVWEQVRSAINPAFAAAMRLDERMRTVNQAIIGLENAGGDEYRRAALTAAADGPDFNQGFRTRFGVETRDPTCDLRVVDFCLSIPGSQYLRDGQSRWLIRRAMRERLPAEVLDRTTRGAQAADWTEWLPPLRGAMLADLSRMERSGLARRCLDLSRMRHLLEHWPERLGMEHHADYNLMLLRGLELGRFIVWHEDRYG